MKNGTWNEYLSLLNLVVQSILFSRLLLLFSEEMLKQPMKHESSHPWGPRTEDIPALKGIPDHIFEDLILPFIGDYHYRFVGLVSHAFQEAYLGKFPRKRTRLNASTMEHVKICYQEVDREISLPRLCSLIAVKGDLELLKYLRFLDTRHLLLSTHQRFFFQTRHPWSRERALPSDHGMTCAAAAGAGHLDVLQFCRDNGFSWNATSVAQAAKYAQRAVLEYCCKNRCSCDERACAVAAEQGHWEILQWCRQNNCPWDEETCAGAARNGHFEILQWCREKDCPWNEQTMAAAAQSGRLDILEWCHENGCASDEEVCEQAAANGRLDILEWCHDRQLPWDAQTCIVAAQNGHLEVLQWCRNLDCPWNVRTCCIAAAQNGHLRVVEWCFDQGCPPTSEIRIAAMEKGHQNVVRWCSENGHW